MPTIEEYLLNLEGKLNATEVRAGFFEGATYPDGTSVPEVAAKNEYGDPANNQPPRPFFRNAIAENMGEWRDGIVRGLRAGVDAENVLEAVGGVIVGDIQKSISTLMEPVLSAYTIKRRKERGNSSTKPLVDTRVMITSVNYEVIK